MLVKNWKKKMAHLVLATSLILGMALPFNGGKAVAAEPLVPVQFLGINDFHGALDTASKDASGNAIGGADFLSANLDLAQADFLAQNPGADAGNSIRVQAGDMVGASPAVSGLLQDEPTMKALDTMDFKVGTLGNHEFDEGLPEYKRILDGVATDKFGPIVANYPRVQSKMEIVAANVVDKGTTNVAEGFKPYTIQNVGGEKIGFIGIVTTEIPNLVLANHIKDYDFLDEAETVAKYAKILRDQGVNAIVVLSHVPALSDGNPNLGTGKDVNGEAANMITKVNQLDPENSVDLVLAGHNHQYTNGIVGSTRIVQSYNNGKAFSNVTGEIDPETGDFVKTPDAKITYNTRSVTPDGAITAITKDAATRIADTINEPIGKTENGTITRETNQSGAAIDAKESALGNLITDAQLEMAEKADVKADFAMTNNGGIRADLVTDANHQITWGAAQAVQPFGNILQVVELDGAMILEALNQQYLSDERYFLQISGLKYEFTDTDDLEHAYKVANVTTKDGEPLDLSKTYKVVINDFLYGGGDGFSAFTKGKLVSAIDPDTETFINYIKAQTAQGKLISAKEEGRKTYKSAEQLAEEAVKAIRDATRFDKLTDKDSFLTGVTLGGASLTVEKAGIAKAERSLKVSPAVSSTAGPSGAFKLAVSSLKLAAGDELTVHVTDKAGNRAAFTVQVEASETEVQPEVPDSSDDPVTSTESKPQEKPSSTTPAGNKGILPATGDSAGLASLAGIFLTSLALYRLRKQ
ncbi:bifunctional metallophosphatase/5'-nucleotidase [Listeria aquatica]|uniref:Bifunctional metallophosphatase/5'-nucleotidase n=1 Tax=Listeria aquatica TaxID=1494960 RepID=A0A841ZQF7_9LIST|nr:bifunctional UDP-sugar hydrolase/5'-nucleotidase [Listeria aquatica]MBC1521672.1 bifunctional metallophosphatase/5'-nucleotidase [Listeria aquatica]